MGDEERGWDMRRRRGEMRGENRGGDERRGGGEEGRR